MINNREKKNHLRSDRSDRKWIVWKRENRYKGLGRNGERKIGTQVRNLVDHKGLLICSFFRPLLKRRWRPLRRPLRMRRRPLRKILEQERLSQNKKLETAEMHLSLTIPLLLCKIKLEHRGKETSQPQVMEKTKKLCWNSFFKTIRESKQHTDGSN